MYQPDHRCALIIVDVQNGFCPGGQLAVAGGDEVIPVINALLPAFEHIVLTQDWHPAGHLSFAENHPGKQAFETIAMPYGPQVLWPSHCVQGSDDAAICESLQATRAKLIIRKGDRVAVDSYSAFAEADKTPTGLAGYLHARGVQTIYLVGLATDFCVAWTALDGREAGFDVVLIEDATRAIDQQGSLAAAWQKMSGAGVKRIASGQIAVG